MSVAAGTAHATTSLIPPAATRQVAQLPISVVKQAAETSFVAGQTIHYTYTVTNNNTVALNNVSLTDSGPGAPVVSCTGTTLGAGLSMTCTASYTATAADVAAGHITDFATAVATVADGRDATGTSNTVTVPAAKSSPLTIVKSVEETAFSAAGQSLHYTFLVTNTGQVPLTSLTVVEVPPLATVTCLATTLNPGQSTTCNATYVTTAADVKAGRITDFSIATASTGTFGGTVTATSNTVTVVACPPCKDNDHGGCKGDNPGGRPGHHEGGGGHHEEEPGHHEGGEGGHHEEEPGHH